MVAPIAHLFFVIYFPYLTFCKQSSIYYVILTVINSISIQYFISNVQKAKTPLYSSKNLWFGIKENSLSPESSTY